MILRIESSALSDLMPLRDGLEELIDSWGYQLHETPLETSKVGDSVRENEKSADPVAIAALILSVPSAALAVTDLADRILKRRRAASLIDKVKQSIDGNTTIQLITQHGPCDLATLSPDQLLDLPKPQDPPV